MNLLNLEVSVCKAFEIIQINHFPPDIFIQVLKLVKRVVWYQVIYTFININLKMEKISYNSSKNIRVF